MELVPCWSLFFFVVTIGLIHSGSSFLYRRDDDQDSPNKVAHLKSRYWNDDIQPCIEKYCLPYVRTQGLYVQCLQAYCPAGLLAVPRDTEEEVSDTFPVSKLLGDTDLCTEPFLDTSPDFDPLCVDGKCPYGGLLKHESAADSGDDGKKTLRIFEYGVYSLCRFAFCSKEKGAAHTQCVREKCCGLDGSESKWQTRSLIKRSAETTGTAARRTRSIQKRFPDQVAQCMQSYCSGLPRAERHFCIFVNCNRV